MAENQSLKKRTIRTATWVILKLAILIPMQVAYIMLLSRILSPTDFGEMAICTIALLLCEVFSQTGIDVVLMRSKERVEPLLDAAWSLQLARGFLIAAVVAAAAYPVAVYQGSDRIFYMMMAIAIVPVIDGMRSMGVVVLGRHLAQGKITATEISSGVLSLGLGVILALWLRSPWAMVIQMIFFCCLRAASGYLIHPFRPRLTLAWGALRPHLRYGVFFNLATCLHHMSVSIDKFIIGRMCGLHLLGLFERCFMVCHHGVLQHTKVLGATAVPSLSAIANDPVRLRRNLRRYVLLNVGLFGGGALIGIVFAEPIVGVVLGEQFLETVALFQVLVGFALCRGVATALHILFDVFGNSQPRFVINLVQVGVLAVALPVGISWHPDALIGAGLAVTLAAFVNLVMTTFIVARFLSEQLRSSAVDVAEAATPELVHS